MFFSLERKQHNTIIHDHQTITGAAGNPGIGGVRNLRVDIVSPLTRLKGSALFTTVGGCSPGLNFTIPISIV